jgi:hypothetical protein
MKIPVPRPCPARPSATAQLAVSAPAAGKLTYGNEHGEKITAQVSSPDGGTPTGTVTVTAGPTTACVITLSAATGTCQLDATALPPGTYPLTAAYSGESSRSPGSRID